MSAAAFALLAVFTALSAVAGLVAWRAIGPRRWYGAPLPIVTAFVALYLAGHRFEFAIGPTVDLFGFDVSLPFHVALAVSMAVLAALVQRPLLAALLRAERA